MSKKTKENDKPIELTFNSIIYDNGNYDVLPVPLIKFMGITNAVFLIGIMNLYNYLRQHKKVEKGKLFYNATTFKQKWDISLYQQNKAIRELSRCRLLKEDGRDYRNTKRLKIKLVHCCSILQLLYELKENPALWPHLSFEKLLKSKKHRKRLKIWLKKMRQDWPKVRFQECGDFSHKNFNQSVLKNLITKHVSS